MGREVAARQRIERNRPPPLPCSFINYEESVAKRVVGKFYKPFLRFGKEIRRWALINLSRFARLTEDERSKGKAFDGYSRETDVERCSVGDSHSGISLLRPACLPLCPFKSRRQRRTRPVSWLLDKLIGPDGTPIPRIPVHASPPPPPIDRIYLNGYLHSTSSPLLPLPPPSNLLSPRFSSIPCN